MDSRTRLAIGGMTAVVASIAVVCAVAMTTSSALADAAGVAVGARPVVVPSPRTTPTPVASPTAVPATPPASVSAPAEPETVPAPEPEDVSASSSPQDQVAAPSPAIEEQLAAAVSASGSWDAVYAWADARGWSRERTDAWIERLDEKIADERGNAADDGVNRLVAPEDSREMSLDSLPADAERVAPEAANRMAAPEPPKEEPPAADVSHGKPETAVTTPEDSTGRPDSSEKEKTSEREPSGSAFGSKRERSPVPPD